MKKLKELRGIINKLSSVGETSSDSDIIEESLYEVIRFEKDMNEYAAGNLSSIDMDSVLVNANLALHTILAWQDLVDEESSK